MAPALTNELLDRWGFPTVEATSRVRVYAGGPPTDEDLACLSGEARRVWDAPAPTGDRSKEKDFKFLLALVRETVPEDARCRLFFALPHGKASEDDRGEDYLKSTYESVLRHLADEERLRALADSLPDKARQDPGAPFEPEALKALALVKGEDLAQWQRLCGRLKAAKVPITKIERALRERAAEDGHVAHDPATAATHLIQLAGSRHAELFHSSDGTAYARFEVDGHLETWPLRAKEFRAWLACAYFEETGSAASSQAISDATNVLEGKAKFEGRQLPVFVRVACDGDAVLLDLCDARHRCVRIDAQGWTVTSPPKTLAFRRPRNQAALPEPEQGGSLDDLHALLGLWRPEDRVLVAGWLLSALRPRGPYFILVLHGEHGCGKSFRSRLVLSSIDPRLAPLRSLPKTEDDLVVSGRNGWALGFDNVSALPDWLSDALCRVSTGGGVSKRELYTDGDEVALEATRPVLLNGIEEFVARPDLLDRALVVRLDPLPDTDRQTEEALLAKFEEARPKILGALCDGVSQAIRDRGSVKLDSLPRMADAALWVTAAEPERGTFVKAYSEARQTGIEDAVESDPVAAGICRLVAKGAWLGSSQELLDALRAHVPDEARSVKGYPPNAKALANRVRRLAPALRAMGIEVTDPAKTGRQGHDNRRTWSLRPGQVAKGSAQVAQVALSAGQVAPGGASGPVA